MSGNFDVMLCVHRLHENAKLPVFASDGAACFDVHACCDHNVVVRPMEIKTIATGLSFDIPRGYRMDVFSRSGHGKLGVCLANAVGKIDSDYKGHLMLLVQNLGEEDFVVEAGMRIAQCELNRVVSLLMVDCTGQERESTTRNQSGFGSTGNM